MSSRRAPASAWLDYALAATLQGDASERQRGARARLSERSQAPDEERVATGRASPLEAAALSVARAEGDLAATGAKSLRAQRRAVKSERLLKA